MGGTRGWFDDSHLRVTSRKTQAQGLCWKVPSTKPLHGLRYRPQGWSARAQLTRTRCRACTPCVRREFQSGFRPIADLRASDRP